MSTPPHVLVVRPRAQAQAWVDELRQLGVAAHGLPLITVSPAPDAAAVRAVADAFVREAAAEPLLVFVSANAVDGFFEASGLAWPATAWAGATGPGTARALREAGVPAGRIAMPPADAASFDSEALWRVVGAWPWAGRAAWIVRGNGGRDWLGDRLREAGARVEVVQSYERSAPRLTPDEGRLLASAQARPADWLWLFSSSEAIDNLAALAPAGPWPASRALATHARIAERARALGFGAVGLVPPVAARVAEEVRAAGEPGWPAA